MRKFIKYYEPHKKLFIADMLASVAVAACTLSYPVITNRFIGQYIPQNNLRMIIISIAALFVIYLIKFALSHFIQYWGHIMGVRIQCDIRRDAFKHLQQLPFSFFDKARSGGLMSRVINDTEHIAEFAHHGPEELIVSSFTIIGAFILLLAINVPLTLIIFTLIPILIIFSLNRRVALSRTSMQARKEVGSINSTLENSISGIRVAKAYDSSNIEQGKFDEGNKALLVAKSSQYKAIADFYSGTNFIVDMLTLVTLLLAGIFVINDKINLVDFATYLFFIGLMSTPIRGFITFIEQLQNGATGFQRITELLDEPIEEDSPNATQLTTVTGDILFDDITFRYDTADENVFSNLTLKVNAGETLALVGPSGGGKSTICHLLPRFYELDKGEILLDGINIYGYTRFSLRSKIGIVQQDTFLFAGNIRDNIAYGDAYATDEQIVFAAKAANIHDYIAQLPDGYSTYIGERGAMLSGGQKQRISIARVFLKNPPILILDEATSALDNATEQAISQALSRLSHGRTTVVVAHRLSTIFGADQIAYISDHQVKELGSHKELLAKNSYYAKLWNAQTL